MPTSETPKHVLIIGASRGIGLGLVREFLARSWHVTATVRSAGKNTGLEAFHQQVTLDTLDINHAGMVNDFVERSKSRHFDVIVINAGVGGPAGKTAETITPEEMSHLFMTNAFSPVRLAYRLAPMVTPETGILAFMSSILGSVAGNTHPMTPAYGASKAALNHLSRTFAAELNNSITVLNLHPGWVRTDMGGEHADIDVATSVKGMADVLESKAGSRQQEFISYKGEILPW